jgi:hypothetical protein
MRLEFRPRVGMVDSGVVPGCERDRLASSVFISRLFSVGGGLLVCFLLVIHPPRRDYHWQRDDAWQRCGRAIAQRNGQRRRRVVGRAPRVLARTKDWKPSSPLVAIFLPSSDCRL